jgi:adenylosuccinate synthase
MLSQHKVGVYQIESQIASDLINTLVSGLDCTGRLFVSDRAQLVFDFHQIVDGLKEVELGGSRSLLCEMLLLCLV